MQIKLNFVNAGKAQLLEPLKTQFGEVHRFFVTDGFTLPWYVRWFHNPFGDGLLAAIWHDFALKTGREKAHYEFLYYLKVMVCQFGKLILCGFVCGPTSSLISCFLFKVIPCKYPTRLILKVGKR
nr:DUF1353 domain-containing protein [Ningiella sp. W23]